MAVPDGERYLVPEGYPVVATVQVDRPIWDTYEPIDDLLNLLPQCDLPTDYGPSVWGPEAYRKSFEKFNYAPPQEHIAKHYPREWGFATRALLREYNFLVGTVLMDITSVSKNSESTPGYPKFLWWKTEADYLQDVGYRDYVRQWNLLISGHRPIVLWYLFLKKEILKNVKIEDSDIRQIVCADPIYSRIGCVFEEDQNVRMKQRTKTRFAQCGWTPFEGGFDSRVKRLASKGCPYWVEFDWTRFDGTIPIEVFRHIKDIRRRFMDLDDVYSSIYDWYLDNLFRRYVMLPSGEITIQERGNPSGQISTTMDNNMVNIFLQAFEFAYLRPALSSEALDSLWLSYDSLVYGDDRLSVMPDLPSDYVDRVVSMYKSIFGMWVKPQKVKVSTTPLGLSFCGFTITGGPYHYFPVPSETEKLVAALIHPVKKLTDVDALYGKLLCYRILMHYASDDDPFKNYILVALEVLARHIRLMGGEEPFIMTDAMLDKLWRGGPKKGYG